MLFLLDVAQNKISLLSLLQKGGWIMYPLYALLVVAIYVFIERMLAIKKAGAIDPKFMLVIKDNLLSGNVTAAKSYAKNTDNPVAKMIEKGILRMGKPLDTIEKSMENVGKLGYIDGISKIIVQNLNLLDETKRPVHCTDSKREVMYVKDDNKWEKENENKQKMRKVIKHVTHKNSKLLKEFKIKYPGCEKSDSKYSDKYDKLIIEAMGGKGDNDLEKEDKPKIQTQNNLFVGSTHELLKAMKQASNPIAIQDVND